MTETSMKVQSAGMKWDVIVTKWGEGDFSVFAETSDKDPYHHYLYDPLWQGDYEPKAEEIAELIDAQVEKDAEAAWESSLQRYYSV
jgi:hypothetical protein